MLFPTAGGGTFSPQGPPKIVAPVWTGGPSSRCAWLLETSSPTATSTASRDAGREVRPNTGGMASILLPDTVRWYSGDHGAQIRQRRSVANPIPAVRRQAGEALIRSRTQIGSRVQVVRTETCSGGIGPEGELQIATNVPAMIDRAAVIGDTPLTG